MAGQGFILNKIKGKGWIFLSASGAIFQKTLAADETMVVQRLNVVAWEPTCHFGFRWSGSAGTMLFAGEGLAETTLTGPGKVIIQSMPFERTKQLFKSSDSSTAPTTA
eukprot:gnl/TRDRNA2_/TRDRNA2_146675_c1_seq1.p2 gnl/TRDRNA2_/TRDRNA2_146675_c1~~gnl/TRDRNA2_/TRDRNA2_146675_c1_seq1.p2  ORF type:complete len:108 (-),score=11.65 gnl/TRDRNA2_/TRDRNA2_146675_c1_seq1:201-524(-)